MTTQDGYKKDAEKYKKQIKEYNMTIEDAREEKIKAEEAIESIVNEFKDKIKIPLTGVNVEIITLRQINGTLWQNVKVKIEVEL